MAGILHWRWCGLARGRRTDPETIYRIMADFAITQNTRQTARNLNMPPSTVSKVVEGNKDKEEFRQLCEKKKKDFAQKASDIIDKGLALLERRLDTALEHENELNELIEGISLTPKEEISQKEKQALITKIKALQLQKLGDITTAIGTLYDKRALAKGESTENTTISIKLPDEMNEYAE